MDFGKINTTEDSNLGAKCHIIDPYTDEPAYVEINGEDVAVSVTLLGPDSDKVKKFQNEMMRAAMKRKKTQLDPQDLERRLQSQIVNAVVSWEGVMMDGELLECTRENITELLSRHTWLRDQLLEFQQNRANFSKS